MQLQKQFEYLYKIMIVGDRGIGKTSLMKRFVENKFDPAYVPSMGVDFSIKIQNINGRNIKLQIWENTLIYQHHEIIQGFYKCAKGIILTFDITNRDSFQNIINWLKYVTDNSFDKPIIILIGIKSDLESNRQVSFMEGKQIANSLGFEFAEASSESSVGVETSFLTLITQMINKQKYDKKKSN